MGKYKIFFLLYKYLQTDTKQYAKNDLTKVKSSLIVLERFKDRMLIQNYSDSTISGYLSSLRGLMAFYNKSPLYITKQQVFKYLVHLKVVRKNSYSTMRITASSIKYYYTFIAKKPKMIDDIPYPKAEKYIPQILSGSDIINILSNTGNLHQFGEVV